MTPLSGSVYTECVTRDQFDQGFTHHYALLLRYARGRVVDQAEDVVQTTYLHAIEHKTYSRIKWQRVQSWLIYKVKRELARHADKDQRECRKRHAVLWWKGVDVPGRDDSGIE